MIWVVSNPNRVWHCGFTGAQEIQFNGDRSGMGLPYGGKGGTPEMRAEISYDLAMGDDMPFVEGTFRLPGGDWQVLIVSAFDRDAPEPRVVPQRWESGVSGVLVSLPRAERINAEAVERALSEALGVTEWVRVRGPDSIKLR